MIGEVSKEEAMAQDKLPGSIKMSSRSRSPSNPSVNPDSRGELRREGIPSNERNGGASFLTREEKRE
jgi:hypothetical protein